MMNKPRPAARGRRTGKPETRAEILAVARQRFLADGYQNVTLRSIATEAGVDVALISYFFGSKKGVFGAALALSANPPEVLLKALPGELETLPERVLRVMVTTWDDPAHGDPLRVMISAATQDPDVARLLRELIEQEMIGRIAERVGGPDARGRAAAFGTHVAGVIIARYVLALEPLASMSVDELIRHLAPGARLALCPSRPARRPPTPPRS
jgi:AcrR family transcriptional regulator